MPLVIKSPTLSVARDPAVAPLLVARLVSSTGVGFGQFALLWGVKGLGYGPSAISLVMACKAAPMLLILAGGIVGDRLRRHQVLAGADALASVTWLALGLCFVFGGASLPLLCLLASSAGVATALFLPTIRSVVADLLVGDRRQCGNALLSQMESAGLMVGLVSAGMVVTLAGPGWTAGAKGVLCAISALLLSRLNTTGRDTRTSPLADLRAGWRCFIGHRWLWMMTVQFTAVIVAAASFTEIVGPLHLSQRNGGADTWGIIAAGEALGALLGGFVGARWRPARPVLMAALLPTSAAIPMILLGGGAEWPFVAAGMLVPGVCQAVYYVLWSTHLQRVFPADKLARVNSWGIVGSFSLTPAALLAAGPLVEVVGTHQAALGASALVVIATALTLLGLMSSRHVPEMRDGGQGSLAVPS